MSESLQFGRHPDADQISSFVEHALPAHERVQMLDHLAVCPECRAVVALFFPEVEESEPAQPLRASARKPWWSGWTLAWPLAGALAAVVLSVAYIRHTAISPHAPAQNQIAGSHPHQPFISQGQSPPPAAIAPQRAPVAQPASSSHATTPGPVSAGSHPNSGTAAKLPGAGTLSIQARNVAPLEQKVPAPAATLSDGVVSGLSAAPSADAEIRARNLASPRPAGTPAPSPPPPPASTGMAPLHQSSETVAVTSAAPLETVPSNSAIADITVDEAQVAQFISIRHSLPSRLPVLSMATQARRTVAIDTRNAVFLSKDSGKHWKAIQAPWPGKAVRAGLIEFPVGNSQDKAIPREAMTAGVAGSTGNVDRALTQWDRPPTAMPGFSITGTVTDRTGAVIPGASISVTNTASHAVRTVKTDRVGHYLVDGLAPGTYKLDAQAAGFMKQELAAVSVTDSRPAVADLSLNVGAATQTVTVEAASNQISVERKTNAKPESSSQAAPVFEIITDNGDHWTSADGIAWKRM